MPTFSSKQFLSLFDLSEEGQPQKLMKTNNIKTCRTGQAFCL